MDYLLYEDKLHDLVPIIFKWPVILPLLPIFIISPSLFGLVGSPTKQKSIFSFFFLNNQLLF